jgi:hypothetical protein
VVQRRVALTGCDTWSLRLMAAELHRYEEAA